MKSRSIQRREAAQAAVEPSGVSVAAAPGVVVTLAEPAAPPPHDLLWVGTVSPTTGVPFDIAGALRSLFGNRTVEISVKDRGPAPEAETKEKA